MVPRFDADHLRQQMPGKTGTKPITGEQVLAKQCDSAAFARCYPGWVADCRASRSNLAGCLGDRKRRAGKMCFLSEFAAKMRRCFNIDFIQRQPGRVTRCALSGDVPGRVAADWVTIDGKVVSRSDECCWGVRPLFGSGAVAMWAQMLVRDRRAVPQSATWHIGHFPAFGFPPTMGSDGICVT